MCSRGNVAATPGFEAVTPVIAILIALAVVVVLIASIVWLIRRDKHMQRTSGQLIEAFVAAMEPVYLESDGVVRHGLALRRRSARHPVVRRAVSTPVALPIGLMRDKLRG